MCFFVFYYFLILFGKLLIIILLIFYWDIFYILFDRFGSLSIDRCSTTIISMFCYYTVDFVLLPFYSDEYKSTNQMTVP